MDEETRQALRRLPSVEELLRTERADVLTRQFSRQRVVDALRTAVDRSREKIIGGAPQGVWDEVVAPETILASAGSWLAAQDQPHLTRVVNASGVVIHTNLGRSLLAPSAVERVVEVARHYNNLEYRLDEGVRGSRHDHVENLLCRLTGAEAAMVVNNNAAAVLLVLAGLAAGREVVVSRGQLVEIGGSFRIPDIMRESGAVMVEVGTTNKTHPTDYETAVGPDTALFLRVHTSNFKIIGFSEEVGIDALARIAHDNDVLVADDLGSGALIDLPDAWREPTVRSSLEAGADVVTFSGDKLLGGPQAGILVGRTSLIERLKSHPLARALRVDKMTLAALEATLLLYQDPERAAEQIPTLRYLFRDPAEIQALAGNLADALRSRGIASGGLAAQDATVGETAVEVVETTGRVGGGALPLVELPSRAVAIRVPAGDLVEVERLLRQAPVPVVGRIADDMVLLDVLTLDEQEIEFVASGVEWALSESVRGKASEVGASGAADG